MTNLTPLRNFLSDPSNDLGDNAWKLVDLVKTMNNKRFIDLGVRNGASSAVLSVDADKNNNKVSGCDLDFAGFFRNGSRFVQGDYTCYQYDSVTLGKNWDEDPLDIVFVDTLHTREFVLAELYYWMHNINEGGYFVFHDTHMVNRGDYVIGGVAWSTPDEAVADLFGLPDDMRNGPLHEAITISEYEDDDIELKHYPDSYGMTFVKVKSLDAIERFKSRIDWKDVFEKRNFLIDLYFNPEKPFGKELGLDLSKITYELNLNP